MAEFSPQTGAAALRMLLAVGILGLAAAGRRTAPVAVLVLPEAEGSFVGPPAAAGEAPDAQVRPTLLTTMTADDLARGVAALAGGQGPGLSAEQRVRLLPTAERGLRARLEVDALSAARRAARERLRGSGLALLSAVDDAGLRREERP